MFRLADIYDKDLNLLIGSGASYGLFPTLKLGVMKDNGKAWSVEDLATHFENRSDPRYIPLFMHYYTSCIRPAQVFEPAFVADEAGVKVLTNYRRFIETVLSVIQRRRVLDRRCNVFTTNYGGCIPLIADEILQRGTHDFVLNDGTRGFRRKLLEARHFSSFICQTGVFDRHQTSVPQVNFIQLHGSVYWRKGVGGIEVDYTSNPATDLLDEPMRDMLRPFSDALMGKATSVDEIDNPAFTAAQRDKFWKKYKEIPVVNPTTWKFHETVYEEHYYQMLRLLSYELEKPNAVLITFGFSFADAHVLNLVKRSLSNPHLQVFVCCYSNDSYLELSQTFGQYRNVKCFTLESAAPLDFTAFNDKVFTLQPVTDTLSQPTDGPLNLTEKTPDTSEQAA